MSKENADKEKRKAGLAGAASAVLASKAPQETYSGMIRSITVRVMKRLRVSSGRALEILLRIRYGS